MPTKSLYFTSQTLAPAHTMGLLSTTSSTTVTQTKQANQAVGLVGEYYPLALGAANSGGTPITPTYPDGHGALWDTAFLTFKTLVSATIGLQLKSTRPVTGTIHARLWLYTVTNSTYSTITLGGTHQTVTITSTVTRVILSFSLTQHPRSGWKIVGPHQRLYLQLYITGRAKTGTTAVKIEVGGTNGYVTIEYMTLPSFAPLLGA